MSPKAFRFEFAIPIMLLAFLLAAPDVIHAQADRAAHDSGGVVPPQVLVDQGLFLVQRDDFATRAKFSWAEVSKTVKPAPWPDVPARPELGGVLPREVAELIEESQSEARDGYAYRAVQLLRQAETLAPDHPEVVRALGLAYAQSGNITRAAGYLRRIAVAQRDDREVLIVLARHAAETGEIEDALMYCLALEQAEAPVLADFFRATTLAKQGYLRAASERLALALDELARINIEKARELEHNSARLLREWTVMKQTVPQLRLQQGDWLLQSGDHDRAIEVYQSVQVDDPTGRHALFARLIYLFLVAEEKDRAVDRTLELIQSPGATAADAGLMAYLMDNGVPEGVLAQRLEAILQAEGITLPRLIALSKVVDQKRLLEPIDRWLRAEHASPDRVAQAMALLRFDDRKPADAQPLAELLALVANLMQKAPEQALDYSHAAVEAIDAPVTLLRAIRGETFNVVDEDERRLLAAVVCDHTGRASDAFEAYQTLLATETALADQALMPAVRLQLLLGQGEQAHELLGDPDIDSPWPAFELSSRAMAAAGKHHGALALIDQRIKARGRQLHLDVLRIEVTAQMGQPQQACNLLLRLISSHPSDEALYRLGIELAYDYRDQFNRLADADRMRLAFLSRLKSNLPDAPLSRMSLAQDIRRHPTRAGEAEALLIDVLQEQPEDPGVLSLLVEFYDDSGNPEAAEAMFERYTQVVGPGIRRSLMVADRAASMGNNQKVIQELDEALALEQEGVLPGPALTGDQASSLLQMMELADDQRDTEALYLSMVRRFPDNPSLNNALGYRWAMQNKNLLQAKAMIQRALEEEPMSHSILDSLAWVQYKLGDLDEAHATQSRALMLLEAMLAPRFGRLPEGAGADYAATTAILNDHMGDILYKRGETRKALDHWRVAQKQEYAEEQMRYDPELRSLSDRLKAKIEAINQGQPAPIADIPGPEAQGPEGHPADQNPDE